MILHEPGALTRLGGRAFLGLFLVTTTSCATGRRVLAALTSSCHGILAWMRGGYGRAPGRP